MERATHRLSAVRRNLHGTYHSDNKPVLCVESGDRICAQTLEVGWRTERVVAGKVLEKIEDLDSVLDNGPALTGPIYVNKANPGSTLEVQFLAFKPANWGWTSGGGAQQHISGLVGVEQEKTSIFWDIDSASGRVTNQWGHSVALSPFLGCVGVASSDKERMPGWWPHPRCGGNLDAKVLTAGSSLYLPVEVEGALVSVGDAHAAQGDGEISGRAIECPMEEVHFRLVHHPNLKIRTPRAKRNEQWITFGVAESLDEAASRAINEMLTLIVEGTQLTRSQALALSSVYVDLRVTQMVNPLKGIHAVLKVPLATLKA